MAIFVVCFRPFYRFIPPSLVVLCDSTLVAGGVLLLVAHVRAHVFGVDARRELVLGFAFLACLQFMYALRLFYRLESMK